jgi:hypothetical protein
VHPRGRGGGPEWSSSAYPPPPLVLLSRKDPSAARLPVHDLHVAMMVTVVAVRVVQLAIHQVVHVVAVGDRLVAAAGSVPVLLIVAVAEAGGAAIRIRGAHLDAVLVDVVAVRVVETAVMQVVGVAIVADCRVAAIRTVLMRVSFVYLVRL